MTTIDQKTVTITVKTLVIIILTLIGFTGTIASGAVYAWFGMSNKVDVLSNKVDTNAKNIGLMGDMLVGEIKKVYCVIDQQNQWHMHKKFPRFDCTRLQ